MKNIVSRVIEEIQKGDILTSMTLFILLVCIFYFYNVYFRKLVEGFARYGPWQTKYIGSSNTKTKSVGLDKDYMVFDNTPQNKQQSNWNDKFSTRVSGRTLYVTRTDYGSWGQGLKLRGRQDKYALIRAAAKKKKQEAAARRKREEAARRAAAARRKREEAARRAAAKKPGYPCNKPGEKKISFRKVNRNSQKGTSLPRDRAGGRDWQLASNRPANSMRSGYSLRPYVKSGSSVSIRRGNDRIGGSVDVDVCIKDVSKPKEPGYPCNKPGEKKISFRKVRQNSQKGTSLPRDRAGGRNWQLASKKPANSIRRGYNLKPRVKSGSNVSIRRGLDGIRGTVDVDVCIKDVSRPKANCSAAEKKAKDAEAKRKTEEAKRKKLEKELAKAIRERNKARLAAGNNAKDIEKYKRNAATADSERKRREADRLRREAEAKKREEERRAAAAEEKAALLRSERDKVATAEKLSQQQRERFNAERKRLMELQKRNENASLSLREKLAKERQARLAAEESLFGAREQIDIVRNTEVNRCATSTERLEQRRKSQLAELRRNQELKEAARRRKLKEERDERLRLDALRREKAKEIAEERAKRLQLLQMKLTREAHEKREQNRLRQVQVNKKIMNRGEPSPSTSLQSGPAPVVGPNGTSVSITGKRMGPSSEMMNRISQYGVDQTNVGLKNSQEGGEETVIAGETTVGGFVYPGQPKMFGHLSNK